MASGEVVARGPGFLPARMRLPTTRALELLAGRLAADGLEPSGTQALAAELRLSAGEVRDLLERAALDGRVVKVKAGRLLPPRCAVRGSPACRLRSVTETGRSRSPTLRDDLGTSRKYAQALLEHFDAERVTRRVGDEHVLRRATEADLTAGPDASRAPFE